jgi:hypothetical protein
VNHEDRHTRGVTYLRIGQGASIACSDSALVHQGRHNCRRERAWINWRRVRLVLVPSEREPHRVVSFCKPRTGEVPVAQEMSATAESRDDGDSIQNFVTQLANDRR